MASGLMRHGPAYSIASCVVETAHRLVATTDTASVNNWQLRKAGRALLTAEIRSFRGLEPGEEKRRFGQGIVLELAFYDRYRVRDVERVQEYVEEQISQSVGGFPSAVQIKMTQIEDDEGWMGAGFDWPNQKPDKHLDFLPEVIDWGCPIQDRGLLQVIGRRLRYRLGIDHADGTHDAFWWTTPQTEEWIARVLSGETTTKLDLHTRKYFNRVFGTLLGLPMSSDPCLNSPDDWGLVALDGDPIHVVTLGPNSGGQTKADVLPTLSRAGGQLIVSHKKVGSEKGARDPGKAYAAALEELVEQIPKRRECDVVVLYRGGISWEHPLTTASCVRIIDAAEKLVSLGVEVVIGIGHGTTSVHEIAGRMPSVGIFEAVTPTAAANWVLNEHVNGRLMKATVDPGQSIELAG
jgi:hypothetical protein